MFWIFAGNSGDNVEMFWLLLSSAYTGQGLFQFPVLCWVHKKLGGDTAGGGVSVSERLCGAWLLTGAKPRQRVSQQFEWLMILSCDMPPTFP